VMAHLRCSMGICGVLLSVDGVDFGGHGRMLSFAKE
jgi:hypothetical protein